MTFSKSIIVITCLLLSTSGFAALEKDSLADRIQPICDEFRAELSGAIRVSAAKETYTCYFGVVSDESGEAPNVNSRFLIASNGKHMVGVAALKLQELGKLRMNEKAAPILGITNPAWQEITVHHLLTHTSGVPSAYDQESIRSKLFLEPVSMADLIAAVKDLPLVAEPGMEWAYSNTGYDLVGEIIRRRSGMTLGAFMAQHLFAPAGLEATTVSYPSNAGDSVARTYYIDENGVRSDIIATINYRHDDDQFAAGNIYSTNLDLHRWFRALLAGQVISAESLARLIEPVQRDYGYGIFNYVDSDGRRAFNHGGSWIGYVNEFQVYPDHDTIITVWRNQTLAEDRERALMRKLRKAVFAD